MRAADLKRLNTQANAGSDLASALVGDGDAELRAAILAYRQVADTLARVTADRLDTASREKDARPPDSAGLPDAAAPVAADRRDPPAPDDPEAAALAARLAAHSGVPVTGGLAFLAREALDMTDGDREAAFALLQSHATDDGTTGPKDKG